MSDLVDFAEIFTFSEEISEGGLDENLIEGARSIEMIKWLLGKGFTWRSNAVSRAAKYGRLDTIQWCFRERHEPMNRETLVRIMEAAAKNGHKYVASFPS